MQILLRTFEPAAVHLPCGSAYRAHDLLRISGTERLVHDAPPPEWVGEAVSRAPWVVVRRAIARNGLIPVGIRGATRAQRHAAWLRSEHINEMRTPEQLASEKAWPSLDCDRCGDLRNALVAMGRVLMQLGLHRWGPTGSAGFELGSGVPTLTATSDLDVILRLERLPSVDVARGWLASLDACGGRRIDCLIELPHGAVALRELAQSPERAILRTVDGPQRLCLTAPDGAA